MSVDGAPIFDHMPSVDRNYVTDNSALRRFELVEEGLVAFADYHAHGPTLIIPHVQSPPPLRGRGTAGRLMQGVAQIARERGIKLAPTCSYAATWFRRNPQWSDVLA